MKLLFIGGTHFVGRHIVDAAIQRGHDVTIFHRGVTNNNLFPEAKTILGDRLDVKDSAIDGSWDAVIDTCGYHPTVVERSVEYFAQKTERYVFISTVSVYNDFSQPHLNEQSPLAKLVGDLPPPNTELNFENYGALKVLCEMAVFKHFGSERSLIIRPDIIVGSYDDTNRFSYWITKLMNHETLRVPKDNEAPIQFIDVRALKDWTISAIEKRLSSIFNVVGPKAPLKFIDFIERSKKILDSKSAITLIDPGSISDNEFGDLYPMYYPKKYWGAFQIDGSKAYHNGLVPYELESTVKFIETFLLGQK
jgi:2'-hydroxyisoflavone reductase